MSAGRGIVHSERTGPEQRAKGPRLFGIQAWAALPKSHEEGAPALRPSRRGRAAAHRRRGQDGARHHGELYGETLAGRISASERSMPRPCWRRAPCCRSTPTTTSARSTSPQARSTSRARRSRPGGCSCSGPATASRSSRCRSRASCCSAASRWTGRATSGGISCPRPRTASTPPRQTGRPSASRSVPGDATEFIPLPE